MTDSGDYFVRDVDDEPVEEEEDTLSAPIVLPASSRQQDAPAASAVPAPPAAPSMSVQQSAVPRQQAPRPSAPPGQASREEQLAGALNTLMQTSPDIEAAALVSLDGFTMASALPPGMQEDRVGAMSAAILALGERAAAELGRGSLSQVFIEGSDGYVLLIAAGSRAVLTALAGAEAKLGLVLYDMKRSAAEIGGVLG